MGNGEVERALTLASRDLTAAGITNPTPEQFQAALMGGAVTNAQGQTTSLDGVLVLRSQGMGWGQIAHTIGVHPSQSERGAANSRRANGAGSFASIGGGGRTDRSAHAVSGSSDRNQVSQSAAAISSSSATAKAGGDRDAGTTTRNSDSGRTDTRITSRVGDSGSDRGPSAQGKNRSDARNTASISSGGDFNRGRGKGSAAGAAVSTESAFGGPAAHAGPGAASRSQGNGKAKGRPDGSGSASASALSGFGSTAGGSFSASAGGTSAGSELSGGGPGKGNGGGKGK
jgi:hypothetical protein